MTNIVTDLSKEELEHYSRQIVLTDIGYNGQLKLRNARVCVVGLGGLGSPTVLQLAAMGVGSIRLVDRDVVELSNLHRQPLYDMDWLGYSKVEAAAARVKKMNPQVRTELFPISLHEGNAEETIRGVDVVIDGLDHIEPRYVINRTCLKLGIPYIFGVAIETFGNLSTIIPGKTPCLECFMPDLKDVNLPTCGVVGVHPSILGIISSLQVSEAVKIILGKAPGLANKFLFCDIRKLSFDEILVSRNRSCPVCGEKSSFKPILTRKLVESVCGRGGRPAFVINPKSNLTLNMKKLEKVLREKGYSLRIKSQLVVSFDVNDRVTGSILKSGITVIEGLDKESKALSVFKEILVYGFGVSWSQID
ncbi:HesA/MoeB/ThiF family protein [Candidatus Bathyarchaeota archaeon]|nr:HesA/MoeB/ThiF family protein [Candidatus Bathyarchaeota archaeon]